KEIIFLSDNLAVLNKKEKFLEQILAKTLESMTKTKDSQSIPLEDYKKMPDFLEEKLKPLYKAKREIQDKQERLKSERSEIQRKLDWNPKANGTTKNTVLVEMDVKRAGNLTVSLSYLVPGASWSAGYDLRIFSGQAKDTLTYSAIVKQETGEDWENVHLTLSSANPMEGTAIPNLEPVFINILANDKGIIMGTIVMGDGEELPGVTVTISGSNMISRRTVSNEDGKYQFTNLEAGSYNLTAKLEGFNSYRLRSIRVFKRKARRIDMMLSMASLQEEVTITDDGRKSTVMDISPGNLNLLPPEKLIDILTETTEMTRGLLSTTYKVKHLNTIASSKEGKKVTVANAEVKVDRDYIAIPFLSSNTFVETKVENTLDSPLRAGPISVFLDGSFVNTSYIRFLNPGESFDVPLGIDKGILVERKPVGDESEIRGFFKKKSRIPLGYKITVKNLKHTQVSVKLRDLIPVSRGRKVKVRVIQMNPDPEKPGKIDKDKGFLTWRLRLKPGEEKVITVKYLITHPKGTSLQEISGYSDY
ncbi:MAG: mucoidy inhibitor MuiA family protein, partial [bacterium]|nr:mucoidy inhibitor MuiA family protein [bacterium]